MPKKKLILIVIDGLTPAAFEAAAEDDRTPALAGRWAIDRRDDGRLLVGVLTHVSVGPVGARNCAHGP